MKNLRVVVFILFMVRGVSCTPDSVTVSIPSLGTALYTAYVLCRHFRSYDIASVMFGFYCNPEQVLLAAASVGRIDYVDILINQLQVKFNCHHQLIFGQH
ncbi:MAG: hypothetical protein H6845_00425 [Alphaproteobacteria bacterium]|nr:MAG: hypothetical protein H6845_00425 [Alphaproteobacteria bacterium]